MRALTPAKVMFLDDNEDLRDLMCNLVKSKLGEDCLCFDSVEDLVTHEPEALKSRIAILDVNLGFGKPSGLDAFTWLKDHGFKGRVVFLTGHAQSHPLVSEARNTGARVWSKPMTTATMFSSIRDVLNEAEAAP